MCLQFVPVFCWVQLKTPGIEQLHYQKTSRKGISPNYRWHVVMWYSSELCFLLFSLANLSVLNCQYFGIYNSLQNSAKLSIDKVPFPEMIGDCILIATKYLLILPCVFQLLGDMLLDRSNTATMTKYVSSRENLRILMNLLRVI